MEVTAMTLQPQETGKRGEFDCWGTMCTAKVVAPLQYFLHPWNIKKAQEHTTSIPCLPACSVTPDRAGIS